MLPPEPERVVQPLLWKIPKGAGAPADIATGSTAMVLNQISDPVGSKSWASLELVMLFALTRSGCKPTSHAFKRP